MPPGNLWTRIFDFENLDKKAKVAYSFDEDRVGFVYDEDGQKNQRRLSHKVYFDPDEAARAVADATCADYRLSEEEMRKNEAWLDEIMAILSERAERILQDDQDLRGRA